MSATPYTHFWGFDLCGRPGSCYRCLRLEESEGMMGGRGQMSDGSVREGGIQASLVFLQVSLACMISSARP